MNLVGKIFVILIFVMSFVFMGFAVVVYSTHTNWKARAEEWKKKLDDVQKDVQLVKAEREDRLKELNEEISRRGDAIKSLQTKVGILETENKTLTDDLAKQKGQLESAISMVKLSHEDQKNLRAELNTTRGAFREAQLGWQTNYKEYVAKTDQANDLALKLANFRSVGERLKKDYRDAIEVLNKHGLKPFPEMYTGTPPKGVEGIVTEVRPNGWLEISLGEDSGIMKDHELDVVRNVGERSSYIGRIKIVRTEPDRAVAVVLPEYRRGTVQRDDKVEYIDMNEFSAK